MAQNPIVGIQETLEVIDFTVAFAVAVDEVRKKENPGWTAVTAFVPPALKAPQAFAGIENVPAEISDRDEQEKAMIIQRIQSLDIDDNHAELVAEVVMESSIEIYAAIDKVIKAIQAAKSESINVENQSA